MSANKEKKKNKFWDFVNDYKHMTIAMTVPSMLFDFAYFSLCFGIGIITFSPWLVIMSFYHVILFLMRINILYRAGRGRITKNPKFSEWRNYRKFSRNLLFFGIILSIAIYRIVYTELFHDFPGFIRYVFMAYVVFKVIVAITNLFKASKSKSLTAMALRKLGITDAIVSFLVLQWAVVRTTGTLFSVISQSIQAYIGFVAVAIIFLMGILGLIKCHKVKKSLTIENNKEG